MIKSLVAEEGFRSASRNALEWYDPNAPDKRGRGPQQYVIGATIKRIMVNKISVCLPKLRSTSSGVEHSTSHLGQFHEPLLTISVSVRRGMFLPRKGRRMVVQRVLPSWISARCKQSSRNIPYA